MTWYDPSEMQAEADGAQRQPEFNPPATEGYDEVEGGISDEVVDLIDAVNGIRAIIDSDIDNGPEAIQ